MLLKVLLGDAVEGERCHSAFKARGNKTPFAVRTAPAGERIIVDPD